MWDVDQSSYQEGYLLIMIRGNLSEFKSREFSVPFSVVNFDENKFQFRSGEDAILVGTLVEAKKFVNTCPTPAHVLNALNIRWA